MSEEILICYKCNGKGCVELSECTSYHNNDYDYWTETCPKCEGSGRLWKKITTVVEERPYATPEVDGSYQNMLAKREVARRPKRKAKKKVKRK